MVGHSGMGAISSGDIVVPRCTWSIAHGGRIKGVDGRIRTGRCEGFPNSFLFCTFQWEDEKREDELSLGPLRQSPPRFSIF